MVLDGFIDGFLGGFKLMEMNFQVVIFEWTNYLDLLDAS